MELTQGKQNKLNPIMRVEKNGIGVGFFNEKVITYGPFTLTVGKYLSEYPSHPNFKKWFITHYMQHSYGRIFDTSKPFTTLSELERYVKKTVLDIVKQLPEEDLKDIRGKNVPNKRIY